MKGVRNGSSSKRINDVSISGDFRKGLMFKDKWNYPRTRVLENDLDDRTRFFITQQRALVYLEKWRNRRYGAVGLMMCSLLNSGRMIAGIRERNVANVFFFS